MVVLGYATALSRTCKYNSFPPKRIRPLLTHVQGAEYDTAVPQIHQMRSTNTAEEPNLTEHASERGYWPQTDAQYVFVPHFIALPARDVRQLIHHWTVGCPISWKAKRCRFEPEGCMGCLESCQIIRGGCIHCVYFRLLGSLYTRRGLTQTDRT